jgi:hypothetical protein
MGISDKQREFYHQKGYRGDPGGDTGISDLDRAYERGKVHRKASYGHKTSFLQKADLLANRPLAGIDMVAAHGIPSLFRLCWWVISLPFKIFFFVPLLIFKIIKFIWGLIAGVVIKVFKFLWGLALFALRAVFIIFPTFLWGRWKTYRDEKAYRAEEDGS